MTMMTMMMFIVAASRGAPTAALRLLAVITVPIVIVVTVTITVSPRGDVFFGLVHGRRYAFEAVRNRRHLVHHLIERLTNSRHRPLIHFLANVTDGHYTGRNEPKRPANGDRVGKDGSGVEDRAEDDPLQRHEAVAGDEEEVEVGEGCPQVPPEDAEA